MISIIFRIMLLLCSIATFVYMIKRIRSSKLQIEYSIFWILFAFLLIVLSIFPKIAIWGANLLGIYSSTNFIFLTILFIMILKQFMQTIEISNLEYRIKELTQKIAIEDNQTKKDMETEKVKLEKINKESIEK